MALPNKDKLPTHLDLPVEDGIPMEDRLHPFQAIWFLAKPLDLWMKAHAWQAVMGANTFVYYDTPVNPVGPDFFVVNGGVEREQGSWVVWDEGGLYPTLIVELLSPTSKHKDFVTNFQIYQDTFRTPDYFIYDLRKCALQGFHLMGGRYVAVKPDGSGLLPCTSLPLKLGVRDPWLRWFTAEGVLLQTPEERADAEGVRADAERARADAERARAEAAERRLAELQQREEP